MTSTAVPWGNLLIQAVEELLPQNLPADLPLRLVGDHPRWEEGGALRQEARQHRQQVLQPSPRLAEMGRMAAKSWAWR